MVAVALQVREGDTSATTPAVYPYRRAALRNLLQRRGDDEVLAKAGSLDLEDDELMRLLEALNDTLIIDGESVWRIVAKPDRVEGEADATGPRQRFEDIDWELLGRHPKVASTRPGPLGETRSVLLADRVSGFVWLALPGRLTSLFPVPS